jgi:hypothetical protein
MSIAPFRSERELTRFAGVFLREMLGSFRKDLAICMKADRTRHHAYFPALITCIGVLDFLSGLYAGNIERHGLKELKAYIATFFVNKAQYEDLDLLYIMFRHKIAHIGYPYTVTDTALDKRLPGPHRRITWKVYADNRKRPIELIYHEPRPLKKSIRPWDVSYDTRILVSIKRLQADIVKSIYGRSGYLHHLKSDRIAREHFAKCMVVYFPPCPP